MDETAEEQDFHERDVALRRGVELVDLVDAEALLELLPDVRAQAVAGHARDQVLAVGGFDRLVE